MRASILRYILKIKDRIPNYSTDCSDSAPFELKEPGVMIQWCQMLWLDFFIGLTLPRVSLSGTIVTYALKTTNDNTSITTLTSVRYLFILYCFIYWCSLARYQLSTTSHIFIPSWSSASQKKRRWMWHSPS